MPADNHEILALSSRILTDGLAMDEETGHQAIHEHINSTILPPLTEDADSPPLHVVAYTIRTAVQHTPILTEIQPLLTLIAHVECIRAVLFEQLRAMKRLDAARDWNKPENDKPVWEEIEPVPFTEEERQYVVGVLQKRKQMRTSYRDIIIALSSFHVYEVWCSPEHSEVDNLLESYFPCPELWGDDVPSKEAEYLFHHGLDNKERGQLLQMAEAHLTLLERFLRDKKKGRSPPPSSSAFRAKYPPPVEIAQVVQKLLEYLAEVEDIVERVEKILDLTDL